MVNKGILHPQEVEIFYIIPTVRRHIAIYMKSRGIKQKDIALMLGISSATISQYSSNKRANKVKLSPLVLEKIKEASLKIKDRQSYMRETQHILHYMRNMRFVCTVHRRYGCAPENCNPHDMGCIANISEYK